MKRLLRRTIYVLLVLVALLVVAFLFRETIVRQFAEFEFKKQTGFEARIGKLHVGYRKPVLQIENLVIYNPPAFGGGPFIELPELTMEYDRDALRAGKLHCKLVRFNLAQVNLVEDAKGVHNFDLLQKRMSEKLPPTAQAANGTNALGNASKIQFAGIETLNLTLGKLTFTHLKPPGQVDEFQLNVNHQVFTNLVSEQDFNGVLLVALLRSDVHFIQNAKAQSWLQLLLPGK